MSTHVVVVVLALALAAPSARAQSAAEAEVLFRNGKRLLKQGKVVEACSAFDASQKLEPTVSTLLNQANCRERNEQLATAWGLFLDAERETRSATDDAGRQLHQVAVDHADKLEARLSTLELRVGKTSRAEGLELRRDDAVIDPAAWNQALPIDGGTYKITARAPGMPVWSTTITVANEKDAKVVEIPSLKATVRAEPAHAEPVKPAPPPPAPPAAPAAKAPPGPEAWYCTQSRFAKIGTCKPKLDACEAFRDQMLGSVHDLLPCAAAASASCFTVGGEPHCAPNNDICATMHDAAAERAGSSAIGACDVKRATGAVVAPQQVRATRSNGAVDAVDFDDPSAPAWSCTESQRNDIGTCKPDPAQCESFRSKLLERYTDLSPCHRAASAHCFDLGKEPHCAPSASLCEAQRQVAAKQSGRAIAACHAKDPPK
ncbi:MAG TPA: hypothetical protein VMJ10_24420 [Kofleriaceae bacterium]|nr:hypothetical protein [Kofleriaceae bacterium]